MMMPPQNTSIDDSTDTFPIVFSYGVVSEVIDRYTSLNLDSESKENAFSLKVVIRDECGSNDHMPNLIREDVPSPKSYQDHHNSIPPLLEPALINGGTTLDSNGTGLVNNKDDFLSKEKIMESINGKSDIKMAEQPDEESVKELISNEESITESISTEGLDESLMEEVPDQPILSASECKTDESHNSSFCLIENTYNTPFHHKHCHSHFKKSRRHHKKFRGFHEQAIISSAINALQIKNYLNGSSSISFCFEDKEVIIKNRDNGFNNALKESIFEYDAQKEEKAPHFTLTPCNLSDTEMKLLLKLAVMSKSSLSNDFTHNTTHLIIGEDAIGCHEYLLAIAYRAYIVTMDWVKTSLLAMTVLLPDGFISTVEEGPQRCLEPVALPFNDFYIFLKISSSRPNYSSYELIKTLCSLGGAKIISGLEDIYYLNNNNIFPRFYIFGDTSLTYNEIGTCNKLKAIPLRSGWVSASISSFKAVPISKFLGAKISLSKLINDYNIPKYLLQNFES